MNKVQILENEGSEVSVSQDVIIKMVEQIVEETEGVEIVYADYNGIKDMVSKKSIVKSLITELNEDGVKIDISIAVNYGKKIHEVAKKLQNKIAQEVTSLAGVKVNDVNISVVDVF